MLRKLSPLKEQKETLVIETEIDPWEDRLCSEPIEELIQVKVDVPRKRNRSETTLSDIKKLALINLLI